IASAVDPNSRCAAARASPGVIPRARFSSTSCCTCADISSASSRSTVAPRTSARARLTSIVSSLIGLTRPHHERDRGGKALPERGFLVELLPSRARQLIPLRAASLIGNAPSGADPPLMFEALERGIQRALLHEQDVVGELADARRDRPAVHRLERERLEDEEGQRALGPGDRFHDSDYLPHLCR